MVAPAARLLALASAAASPALDRATPDGVALAYIAMGKAARESIFAYAVDSARRTGGWRGEIFVVTDQPACAPNGTVVITALNRSTSAPTLHRVVHYKTHKMRLLELLPPRVRHVLYLDLDILVGAPLHPLLEERRRLDWQPAEGQPGEKPHLLMVRQFSKEPWHTGAILLRRNLSEACLDAWRLRLLGDKHAYTKWGSRDQVALKRVSKLGSNKSHCRVGELRREYLIFPRPRRIESGGPWPELVHVTRTGRLHLAYGLSKEHLQLMGAVLLEGVQRPPPLESNGSTARAVATGGESDDPDLRPTSLIAPAAAPDPAAAAPAAWLSDSRSDSARSGTNTPAARQSPSANGTLPAQSSPDWWWLKGNWHCHLNAPG